MEARGGVRCSARLSGEAASARTTSSSGNGAPGRPAIDAAAAALRRARAAERAREVEDSPRVLRDKCRRLARALRNAKHLVVYTGAGISTAADIPDYRGPDGVWTRLQRGETVGRVEVSRAQPTFTHMALTALWARGTLKFVVSQNCDGLHLRAGLPRRALAELHGDMFAELCAACRRVYLRAFDTTERTARHAHGTRRLCHTCGAELRDSIVHFGERGRAAWPLNWAGALRHAGRADVVLCLGSSLKVLRRYPRLWRMHAAPRDRPALYIVNLQWTPKDAVAALKINARCDAVMRQVARRLRLRVPRYRADRDPLLAHAEPLQPAEAHTTRRPLLRAPPRPAPRPRDDCSAEDFSSPSASDSDEELPLRRLAERLRAPDAKPSPPTSRPSSPKIPNGRHPSPNARSRSPHTESSSPNARLSSPDTEPPLQNTRLLGPSLPNNRPRSPAMGPPIPNRLPSPDTESRSRDARFLPPDTGPPPDARLPLPNAEHSLPPTLASQNPKPLSYNIRPSTPKSELTLDSASQRLYDHSTTPDTESQSRDARLFPPDTGPPPDARLPWTDAEHSSPPTLATQNPKPLSYNIRPSTPKPEPSELTLVSAPQRLYDHSTPPDTRPFVPNMRLPKFEAPPMRPPFLPKLSPTSAKRPLPDLLRAFQVSMRSGEATILLRAQHAPPPPAAPPAGPALHALRSFRMVRPRPPTLNGNHNHAPIIQEFAIKKEEYLVKKDEYLVKKEEYLVKKEEDGVKGEEGEGARGLGSRLRRLLECSPRLKPSNGDASSGEESGARALAAAYIARAVLVCRAQLYPGLHTIISPAAAAAAVAPAECAWCYRRHGARRCLWYGPPRCTPADARASRRRQLCACCDAPGASDTAPSDADGGGWYGKGYRKGRRRRR